VALCRYWDEAAANRLDSMCSHAWSRGRFPHAQGRNFCGPDFMTINQSIATADIAPLRPFDDAAAIEWLRAQGGSTKLKPGELGKLWGWDKMAVGRRLAFWERRSLIARKRGTITVLDASPANGATVPAVKPAGRPKASQRPPLARERGEAAAALPVPLLTLAPVIDRPATATALPSVARSIATTVLCLCAYLVAFSLAAVAAFFSIHGMIVLFPGAPTAIVAMGVTMEVGKLVSVAFLAHQWGRLGFLSRAALILLIIGLAGINFAGTYSQLVAVHYGDRMSTTGAVQTEQATLAARIDAQSHALADVDVRLSQIDGAIAAMVSRGRSNGALDVIASQRKARAELVAQRQREADVLTGLKTEQAAAVAKAHAVEVEAAPIMYVAQLLGGTTEQAIRWLILAIVLCCDPLAIALTGAASGRR
jgi:hypothetical protein